MEEKGEVLSVAAWFEVVLTSKSHIFVGKGESEVFGEFREVGIVGFER